MDLVMMSETQISWIIGFVIILIFLVPYIFRMKRKDRISRDRLSETRSKGQEKALMQHPIINQSACIGCGICVDSCPEGDVLGIISGKATIIHGSHCVGHGKCAEACPLNAIQVGLGDISQRQDIPRLSDQFETNRKGIYIIGELSGLALIKNAISHGITAIQHVKDTQDHKHGFNYDVVIVGAGPSGLAAALKAKELGLRYIMIDQDEPGGTILQYPRRKVVMVQPVHLPLYGTLDRQEYEKEELLEIWNHVLGTYELNFVSGKKLTDIQPDRDGFIVHTNTGDFDTAKVILALGRRGTPRKLGVPGEEMGKVMYKLIDAESYQNKHILIVGGGDSAIEAALGLTYQPGNTVTVSYRKSHFFRLKSKNESRIHSEISKKSIRVLFNSNIVKIDKEHITYEIDNKSETIKNDYVFIFAGGELPFKLLDTIGIDFGQHITSA